MVPKVLVLALYSCLMLIPISLTAGSFGVSPIRLFLNPDTKTAAVNLSNNSENRVNVQLEVRVWKQNEKGEDVFESTKDILFFPKIFSMDKGQEMIARVSYQGEPIRNNEKTYRLFIVELPVRKPGESEFKMPLRLSIPIFVGPDKEIPKGAIEAIQLHGSSLKITIKNTGKQHLSIKNITAIALDKSGSELYTKKMAGWYVLSGVSRNFDFALSEEECRQGKIFRIFVEADQTKFDTQTEITNSNCSRQ